MWKDFIRYIVVIFQTTILRIVWIYVRHSATSIWGNLYQIVRQGWKKVLIFSNLYMTTFLCLIWVVFLGVGTTRRAWWFSLFLIMYDGLTLIIFHLNHSINYAIICTNYQFIYRMFKGMIVIFAAVLTAATAKEAKGKYLKFTANLWLYF